MTRVIGNWKPVRGEHAIKQIEARAAYRQRIDAVRKAAQRAPGPEATRRAKKARRIVEAETIVKNEVKRLDGWCRWPNCDGGGYREAFILDYVIDACHYRAEGIGGDPKGKSFTPENLIALHRIHHVLLHNDLARMRPLDEALGMRGPVEFSAAVPGEAGKFYVVGITSPPEGVSE